MTDRLGPDTRLDPGGSIASASGRFTLDFQSDANLVLYKRYPDGGARALWASGTAGQPLGFAVMQGDGNLVVYGPQGQPLWSSGTHGRPGSVLVLQDDGNLVVYDAGGRPIWATNTLSPVPPTGAPASGDTASAGSQLMPDQPLRSPGGRFEAVFQTDANLVVYKHYPDGRRSPVWASGTSGRSLGTCVMQGDGNLVVYGPDAEVHWATDSAGHPGARLVMQDDGNLVVYEGGSPLWASNSVSGFAPSGPAPQGDRMVAGDVLAPGGRITSQNGRFTCDFQADANLVVYKGYPDGRRSPLWASATDGRSLGSCILQGDGNLVVYGVDGEPHWATDTHGHPGAYCVMQDDGNLVVYEGSAPLWASDTVSGLPPTGPLPGGAQMDPGHVLTPDASLRSADGRWRLTYQGDGNLVVYADRPDGSFPLWASDTAGRSVGCCVMQGDGNLVVYGADGEAHWSSDTHGHPGAVCVMQDDGNLVVHEAGNPLWATDTPAVRRRTGLDSGGEGWDGWCEMVVRPNGDWTFSGDIVNWRPEGIDYRVSAVLGSGSLAVAASQAGEVDAYLVVTGEMHGRWSVSGNSPALAAQWEGLLRDPSFVARAEVEGDISGFVIDAVESIVALAVGAILITPVGGLIILLGAAAVSWVATGSPASGLRVVSGLLWMAGPFGTAYAVAADALADAFTEERQISQAEYDWANAQVYNGTLPARDRIYLSDAIGFGNRAFTFPGTAGRITISLGPDYADPRTSDPALLIHELAHAWQIEHTADLAWFADAIWTQLKNEFSSQYAPPADPNVPWGELNLEQQATIVETWWRAPRSAPHRYDHYVNEKVRLGDNS